MAKHVAFMRSIYLFLVIFSISHNASSQDWMRYAGRLGGLAEDTYAIRVKPSCSQPCSLFITDTTLTFAGASMPVERPVADAIKALIDHSITAAAPRDFCLGKDGVEYFFTGKGGETVQCWSPQRGASRRLVDISQALMSAVLNHDGESIQGLIQEIEQLSRSFQELNVFSNRKEICNLSSDSILPARFMGESSGSFVGWVNRRLEYPSLMCANGIGGAVSVSFTVLPDGTISDIEIGGEAHNLFKEEVRRVIQDSPLWDPGVDKEKGVAVPIRCSALFVFSMYSSK